jgi:hypothetical protein
MSTRTKILGGLAILMFVLFMGFESEAGQRFLRDSFDAPFDPEDLMHGTAILPAVIFFVPGLGLGIAALWSKMKEGRHHHR